jgi:hypothetical protein
VVWILRLVKIGAEAEGQAVDVMEINRLNDLGDIADLGLPLADPRAGQLHPTRPDLATVYGPLRLMPCAA